jgi:hypothetical protein
MYISLRPVGRRSLSGVHRYLYRYQIGNRCRGGRTRRIEGARSRTRRFRLGLRALLPRRHRRRRDPWARVPGHRREAGGVGVPDERRGVAHDRRREDRPALSRPGRCGALDRAGAQGGSGSCSGCRAIWPGWRPTCSSAKPRSATILAGELDRPEFPEALREHGPERWRWEAALGEHADREDAAACLGMCSVAVVATAQARMLARREWVLNEKGLIGRAGPCRGGFDPAQDG